MDTYIFCFLCFQIVSNIWTVSIFLIGYVHFLNGFLFSDWLNYLNGFQFSDWSTSYIVSSFLIGSTIRMVSCFLIGANIWIVFCFLIGPLLNRLLFFWLFYYSIVSCFLIGCPVMNGFLFSNWLNYLNGFLYSLHELEIVSPYQVPTSIRTRAVDPIIP